MAPKQHQTTDELTQARQQVASYSGLIARWCQLTGNEPKPTNEGDLDEQRKTKFKEYLNRLEKEQGD